METKGKVMTYQETKEILQEFQIPFVHGELAKTLEEVHEKAEEIGYPVALKLVSADVTHKMDAGAVKLNLQSKEEIAAAYQEIFSSVESYHKGAEIEGFLVQEMLTGGVEVIAGMSQDPLFGPVIVFGLGGIFVEVLKDISMGIPPINKKKAMKMIEEIKGYPLLQGYRNTPPVDLNSLCDILTKLSALSLKYKEKISQIDLNPILVTEEGAKAVDMLFVS